MVSWIKEVLLALGIAFVVFYLFARPEATAEAVRTFFGALKSIARSFSRLVGQPAVRLSTRLLEPNIQRYLLVEEDERVINEVRRHWMVSLPWVGVTFLSVPTFVLAIVARGFFWIPMLVRLYLLGLGFQKAHVAHVDRFVITNIRMSRIYGVLNIHLATIPMTRVLDVPLEQLMFGKVLGYEHLVFESAAQAQGLQEIRYVVRPAERDLIIQRVIQRSGLRKKTVMGDEDKADRV